MGLHVKTAYEYGVKKALETYGYASPNAFRKEAMHLSTGLGAIPVLGPTLSGATAGYDDDSFRSYLGTSLGSGLGQLGGGLAGAGVGALLGRLSDDDDLAAALAALGGLGGMAAGGGFGASKGRETAQR